MKKILALVISLSIVLTSSSCMKSYSSEANISAVETIKESAITIVTSTTSTNKEDSNETSEDSTTLESTLIETITDPTVTQFYGVSDPALLQYAVDDLYSSLDSELDENVFVVDSVNSMYLSEEYIEELSANSQENIFFGYKLSELDTIFEGKRYMFVSGDTETTVREAGVSYDDTWDKIIQNVTVGTGVIFVCVTISIVSGGLATIPAIAVGATKVSCIFTVAANSAIDCSLSFAAMSMATTAILSAFTEDDLNEIIKKTLVSGSEGYKIGAIVGAVSGAASETFRIFKSSKCPSPRQSEVDALKLVQKDHPNAVEQKSYLHGEEVPYGTPGATRPDVIVPRPDGSVLAYEVKNYNLESNYVGLVQEVRRQVGQRLTDLPNGSVQEIILDVRGRGYSSNFLSEIVTRLQGDLADIYPDILIHLLT